MSEAGREGRNHKSLGRSQSSSPRVVERVSQSSNSFISSMSSFLWVPGGRKNINNVRIYTNKIRATCFSREGKKVIPIIHVANTWFC